MAPGASHRGPFRFWVFLLCARTPAADCSWQSADRLRSSGAPRVRGWVPYAKRHPRGDGIHQAAWDDAIVLRSSGGWASGLAGPPARESRPPHADIVPPSPPSCQRRLASRSVASLDAIGCGDGHGLQPSGATRRVKRRADKAAQTPCRPKVQANQDRLWPGSKSA